MTPQLDAAGRWRRLGGTLWLIGLPGALKTTLAAFTRTLFDVRGWPGLVLGGYVLHRGLSRDPTPSGLRPTQAATIANAAPEPDPLQ